MSSYKSELKQNYKKLEHRISLFFLTKDVHDFVNGSLVIFFLNAIS